MFAVVGLVAAVVMMKLKITWLRRLSVVAIIVCLALLLYTIIPGAPGAVEVNGNTNWLRFGPSWTQFQPSEFAKVALALFAGDHLARKQQSLGLVKEWLPFVIVSLGIVVIVGVGQSDLGTAVVIAAMVMSVMIIGGAPWKLIASLAIIALAGVTMLIMLFPNRLNRLVAFLNPGTEVSGTNMQSLRGTYALASGGWWGEGLGASKQKWGLLSEAHTDYIFAIIGEELGLVGTLTILGCFVMIGFFGLRVVRSMNQGLLDAADEDTSVLSEQRRTELHFCRHAATAVVAWITVQAMVNMAVVLGYFPVMGVPLPLVSYGGSSLIAVLAGLGLLVACAYREPSTVAWITRRRQRRATDLTVRR
jgi:cell division protein FtsW